MSENAAPPPAAPRLMSLDALRGFDMFWILGGGTLVLQLDRIVNRGSEIRLSWLHRLAGQMQHTDWAGFTFEDFIFPLFVFIMGISIVFSVGKQLQRHGKLGAYWRIVRRAVLLFALGVIATGGLRNAWPDVQLSGVLHRLAWCYLAAAILFCHFRARGIALIATAILLGYWALLALVPVPAVNFDDPALRQRAKQMTSQDFATLLAGKKKVTGSYEKGLNLGNYLDALYLPGRKNDVLLSNEGLLSTLPAIASCLLGVLAGMLLVSPGLSDGKKLAWLAGLGLCGVLAGFLWGLEFPIIKKLWTSSYVLVAGGFSALMMAAFYLLVDVWKRRTWCQPFVWIGMNSITIYLLHVGKLVDFDALARRLVGGDVSRLANQHIANGAGDLLVTVTAFVLIFAVVGFLYRKKIFLRV